MKTNLKLVVLAVFISLIYACKQASKAENVGEMSADEVVETTEEAVSSENEAKSVASSSAAVEPKNSKSKFVRTADIKFKVKNVAKSTTSIEDATQKFGGFVSYTNLESQINDTSETRISQDSILETIKFTVRNDITIRVPNTRLDTLIKTIAKEIEFLDGRLIKADDVTLQILANKMAQNRNNSAKKRIENAVDSQGRKLNQIVDAEDVISQKNSAIDDSKLENLSLENQVNFSTITLSIYQRETTKNSLYASEKSINNYRPHLGMQIWDSFKTGWFMLESIIAFVVQLWALILIAGIIWFAYKKFKKAKP